VISFLYPFFSQIRQSSTTEGDLIVVNVSQNPDEIIRDKLAFSHGLINCVKLGVLESQLDSHIESVRHIPEHMLLGKGIPIDSKQVLVKIGELLSFRAQLNLHSEIIETPDIYWDEPKQEEMYNRVTRLLELRSRVNLLNRKLDYAKEFSEVLKGHLGETHSHNLEKWIIFEVFFGFFNFFGVDGQSLLFEKIK
jgi:uncharacterized Rmd1/YagE family protein